MKQRYGLANLGFKFKELDLQKLLRSNDTFDTFQEVLIVAKKNDSDFLRERTDSDSQGRGVTHPWRSPQFVSCQDGR